MRGPPSMPDDLPLYGVAAVTAATTTFYQLAHLFDYYNSYRSDDLEEEAE
jgi:hypothetical protein